MATERNAPPAEERTKKKEKTSTFRVRSGHTVNHDNVMYGPGDEVDLTDKEAQSMPWAVESGDRRRPGQTSRMQKRIKDLQREIEELRSAGKPGAKRSRQAEEDHDAAVESIRQRGDAHAARGEPHFGQVPIEVEERYQRGQDVDYVQGGASDDEETGLHGMGREAADEPSGRINPASPVAKPSMGGPDALDEDRGQQSTAKQQK